MLIRKRSTMVISIAVVLVAASCAVAQQERGERAEYLSAGPITVKFQDGELRYLYVGDKEIIRRIYFAVRDGAWDTIVPEFIDLDVQAKENSFAVTMRARCRSKDVDYSWTGEIVGSNDGEIKFRTAGRCNKQMKSAHVGICVLYGAESLAGQSFIAFDVNDRQILEDKFTELLAKEIVLVRDFRRISYTAPDRMSAPWGQVDLTFGSAGRGQAGMEDQRYFGDSSYKVFKWELAEDPNTSQVCEVTLQVSGAARQQQSRKIPDIRIGDCIADTNVPQMSVMDRARKSPTFLEMSSKRDKLSGAGRLAMAYSPPANLADEDTLMENIPAILDQVRTLRTFASRADISLEPVNFESPYPRPGPDPRGTSPFATAWCARVIKYMTLAGVENAAFTICEDFVEEMAKFSGRPLRRTTIDAIGFETVDALAIDNEGGAIIWLINKTAEKQIVTVNGGEATGLAPYEVRKVEPGK